MQGLKPGYPAVGVIQRQIISAFIRHGFPPAVLYIFGQGLPGFWIVPGVPDKSRTARGEIMFLLDKIKNLVALGAASQMTDKEFLEVELAKWRHSKHREEALCGEAYYNGDHDILRRKRQVIGEDGKLKDVYNLPNNRLIDNQYQKMVNQKVNYMLSKPITYESGNKDYDEQLKTIFDANFQRRLKACGIDGYCGGGSWLYVYIGGDGKLKFQRFPSYEVLPFWKDSEHEELDCAVRLYAVEVYEGTTPKIVEKVEVFHANGLERYTLEGSTLTPDMDTPTENYIKAGDIEYNWPRIPLVFFRTSPKEIPLIRKLKGLQDALNTMLSDLPNAMEENAGGQGILVVKNYDGTNLGEFRKNLSTYRAVKVRTVDGADGGIDSISVEVNPANYETVLKLLKKAIIENAMGYDAKDDRLGGNANTMNIRSMYSDIDLDANDMESEYQAAFSQLLELVASYMAGTGKGDYRNTPVKITFNRDMIFDELAIMQTLSGLGVELSNETLIGQVPFVDDVQKEIERLKKQKEENMDIYGGSLPPASNINLPE